MQFCALKTCPPLTAEVNISDMYKLTFAAFSFKESKAMSKMQSEKLYNNLICKQTIKNKYKTGQELQVEHKEKTVDDRWNSRPHESETADNTKKWFRIRG